MKKLLVALLIAIAMVSSVCAGPVDFSSYSDDEIVEILSDLNQEMMDRNLRKSADIPAGNYVVGVDIPAGGYDVHAESNVSSWLSLYFEYTDENGEYAVHDFHDLLPKDGETLVGDWHVTANEGDTFVTMFPLTITMANGVIFN